jgi:hypothetical protein
MKDGAKQNWHEKEKKYLSKDTVLFTYGSQAVTYK